MPLLEIDSVNFSYGQNKILSDIYLKVDAGEVVGFLGRNGCGKSTLLKVIFGSLRGEYQCVRINGKYAKRAFQTGELKFVPQDTFIPDYLTAKQATQIFDAEVNQLEAFEEFRKHQTMKFSEMSTGIRKYIETLIILHSPCSFVLLDEPFSYISPILVEKLIPIIKNVSKQKGILLTDHQYRSILDVSDRLYLLGNCSIYPISGEENLRDFGYIL